LKNTICFACKFDVQFLPNAIDYERFVCKTNRQISTKLRLINVGSYQTKKNQCFLVEVAKILKNRNIDFEINFLGDGEKFAEVAKLICENNLDSSVFQRGNVDNVEEYLWQSDIYIHSSYYEPFGLVLLEAMAAGLPVVTLDGRGNRDLIVQGKNGYMVYKPDAQQFANCILEIWNDKSKYQAMSEFAQQFAQQFDINPYIDRLLAVYNKMI